MTSFGICRSSSDYQNGRYRLRTVYKTRPTERRQMPKMFSITDLSRVGVTELESVTSSMSTKRSNQLS